MTSEPALKTSPLHARLARLPVANIGDAMNRLGVLDPSIKPVWQGARLAGPAYTVEVSGGDNAGIYEALAHIQPGAVLVVNGHSVTNRALIGELISERLRQLRVAGVVIDGAVRDAHDIEQMRFPVFCSAITPAGPFRNGPFRIDVPVAVGGVVVSPGDLVVGDDDGVAVIPFAEVPNVLDLAERKNRDEAEIRAAILARA
ncbi:methyltransferase [Diaminobutyricimonas sp. TR449]|uniref:RraA family protein n=1 Tax=Diaminobutyricimonas sp. TR449 TaxID=2708076 RepID=UPI00142063DB|nr:methyltransferase [Diaminobutyricimonas sp. TR449]